MAGRIDARLSELGIELPESAAPVANYLPFVASGGLVFVAGQVTSWKGKHQYVGKLGVEVSIEEGYQAARVCGLNLLTQFRAACDGDLDRVKRLVKLGIFVNSAPDFTRQPEVANGASDLMVEVFGDAGRHARFAVGAPALPLGVAVEADAVFELT
jgi:enamine deaminase RidA (YjgF/YER057c/UK114 family)